MRIIKFRAWDGKEMIYSNRSYYFVVDQDKITLVDSYESGIHTEDIMQFTGTKDKNGVDIYEGDIVRHRNGIKPVQWIDSLYSFQMGLSNYVVDQEVGDDDNIEVIGNIYENSELLNNK